MKKSGTRAIVGIVLWLIIECHVIMAQGPISCGNNKVLVCHKGMNTLCVSENAVQAHLDHGDYLGPCTMNECGVVAKGGEITCNNTVITLAAFADVTGTKYSWAGPGNFMSVLQMPETSVAGAYIVTITDTANGCTASDTAVVTENLSLPEVELINKTLTCTKTSVALSSDSTASQSTIYSWKGPLGYVSTQLNTETSLPGEYVLTVTNSLNGCQLTDTVWVIQNDTLPADVSTTVQGKLTCSQTMVTLTGTCATNGVTYKWLGPNGFTSAEQVTAVSSPGNYSLLVTDPDNGCSSSSAILVEQNITVPKEIIATSSGRLSCIDSIVGLTGFMGGDGNFFGWQGPNGFTSDVLSPSATVPGEYTFLVADTVSGCSKSVRVVVEQDISIPEDLTASVSDTLDCIENHVILSASSATSGVEYSWTGPQNYMSDLQSNFTNIPGLYTVTATYPLSGCVAKQEVMVIKKDCPGP